MATVAVGLLRSAGAHVAGQGDRLRRRADPGDRGRRDPLASRRGGDAPADVPGRRDGGAVAVDRLADGDGRAAWDRCAGALDDACGRPPGRPSVRVCRRALVGVRLGPADPGDALDAPGLRRGVALAPPRRRRPRRRRADRRPGVGGRGRPIALGLVGRAAGPAVAGDREERALRDRRAGPVVDLGGAGPVAAVGASPPPRLDARSAATCRGRRLRRAGAGLRPGLLAAGPVARPPGRRVGLLRVGRPLAPARRARDAPLRRLGPQPV